MRIPIYGIYAILIGEKYYIGMSKNIFTRWQSHYTLMVIGKHHSPELQFEFNKVGILGVKFYILYKVNTKGKSKSNVSLELRNKEKEIMGLFSKYNSLNKNKKYFKT